MAGPVGCRPPNRTPLGVAALVQHRTHALPLRGLVVPDPDDAIHWSTQGVLWFLCLLLRSSRSPHRLSAQQAVPSSVWPRMRWAHAARLRSQGSPADYEDGGVQGRAPPYGRSLTGAERTELDRVTVGLPDPVPTLARSPSAPRVRATPPALSYTELAAQVRSSGLLQRRHAWYWRRIAVTVSAFVAIWVAVVALGDSWFQLLLAVALGFVVTQFGFLGHDAAHRQMFASARWNDWTARILSAVFAGLCLGWWKGKHNLHHADPNKEGRDPDIGPGALAFTREIAARRTRQPEPGSCAVRGGCSSRCSRSRGSTSTKRDCATSSRTGRPRIGAWRLPWSPRGWWRTSSRWRCSCPGAWPSPSSSCRWRSSACAWVGPSRRATRACRSCPGT